MATRSSSSRNPAVAGADSLIAYLQERVQEIVDGFHGVERRRVLASDGWFVAGKRFTLVTRQGRIVVRLPDAAAQEELLAIEGTAEWTIPGKKPMRGWLLVPETMHDDTAALTTWLQRSFALAPGAGEAKARSA